MSFSDELWKKIDTIYQKTISQPFIVELADGSLPIEKFIYYISQDSEYLPEYSRVMAVASLKAGVEDREFLLDVSKSALNCETELHREYARRYKFSKATELSPACFAYVNYMLGLGLYSTLPVLTSALLPCAWIYAEVGLELSKRSKNDNKYIDWINTYADPAFMAVAMRLKAMVDRFATTSSKDELMAMERAFITSSRLEYMFWNDSYNLAKWVV